MVSYDDVNKFLLLFRTSQRIKQTSKKEGAEILDEEVDSDDGDLELLPGSTGDYLRS